MEERNPTEKKLEESIEYYLGRISGTSQVIYLLFTGIILVLVISMALVRINITVSARGILRPQTEKSHLYTLSPGKVDRIMAEEGAHVKAGDTLLVLDMSSLLERMNSCRTRSAELRVYISDLLMIRAGQPAELISQVIGSEYRQYTDQAGNLQMQLEKARKERRRLESLYSEKLVSEKEYDDLLYREMILEKELAVTNSAYEMKWEDLLERYRQELREIRMVEENLLIQIKTHIFIAPVDGYIDEFSGIYPGSHLRINQPVLTISPDTGLIAEIYLPAGKAGSIYPGQQARILIDAYNYREWGSLNSSISEISNDAMIINEVPVFRIRCRLQESVLSRRNGQTGRLKQGMTCTARFAFSRRTILQLLLDSAEDWIRPVQSDNPGGT